MKTGYMLAALNTKAIGKAIMEFKFYRKTTSAGIDEEFGVEIWKGGSLITRIPAVDEESAHVMLKSIKTNAIPF